MGELLIIVISEEDARKHIAISIFSFLITVLSVMVSTIASFSSIGGVLLERRKRKINHHSETNKKDCKGK